MLITPLHVGTHIDALCHFTTGDDNHMYNGVKADEVTTNYGPSKLAADKVYEFCLICTAPKVRYATGMFVRPIAVI